MVGEGNYSLSDLAAATGNKDGVFGGSGVWLIFLFLIFVMGGYGRNGYGTGSGAMDNYVLNSDFSTLSRQMSDGFSGVERGIDTIRNGLCDGFYTEAQLVNGVNANIAQLGTTMQGYSCQTQRAIDGVNYNMATNTCSLNTNINSSTRDIVESQNANTRAILDAIATNRLEDKNAQIAAQTQEITALRLAASQQAQNNYLVSQLRPSPIPAYQVANPYTSYCNNGCCGC